MPGSLAARDISKSYAAVQVLDRISLVVSPGDRIGIVGPNGIGKSTLLRVLAGLEPADGGRIIRSGAVGFLPQEPEPRAGETVLGYLGRRTGVGTAADEMDALAARLGEEPELAGAYADALDRFLALGGEDFEARARAALTDVGLGRRTEREMTTPVGRRGGARRAGRDPARALRRLPARRADEQPRLRRARAPRALPRRAVRGRRARVARPGIPRPDGHPRRRDGGRDAEGARVRRHVVGVRGGTRPGAGAARPGLRATTSTRRRATRRCSATAAARRRCSARRRSRGRRRLRPARDATPSAGRCSRRRTTSSGSRRSRSRGRRGACASSCRPPHGAASSSRSSQAPSSSAARSGSARSRSSSTGATASPSSARTAPARRR